MPADMNDTCIFCASDLLVSLMEVDRLPDSSQMLFKTRAEALNSPARPFDLKLCPACGLLFNGRYAFDQGQEQRYRDANYHSATSHSPQSQQQQRLLADEINRLTGLKGLTVCEIGCGDGYFLSRLARYSRKAMGFEPSSSWDLARQYDGITVYNAYFDPANTDLVPDISADLMVMRHLLEHLENPFHFLSETKRHLRCNGGSHVFIEVPDATHLLTRQLYFDFYNDHIFYFSHHFLSGFLKGLGFNDVFRIENDNQEFLQLLASAGADNRPRANPADEAPELRFESGREFGRDYLEWKRRLIDVLHTQKSGGKRIAAWGAGARGVTMLASLNFEADFFEYIVDSDPIKQGRYVPLLGSPVVPVGMLETRPVDCLLVTSYTFFGEILEMVAPHRETGMKVVKPYPQVELI